MQENGQKAANVDELLNSMSNREEVEEYARQLHSELLLERQMHAQARESLSQFHLPHVALEEQALQYQAQMGLAKDMKTKKRKHLRTYMDPVVIIEHHLLTEKHRALEASEANLRDELVALQCQKDSNSQVIIP